MITLKLRLDPSFRYSHDVVYLDVKSVAAFEDEGTYADNIANCYRPSAMRNRHGRHKRNYIGRFIPRSSVLRYEITQDVC